MFARAGHSVRFICERSALERETEGSTPAKHLTADGDARGQEHSIVAIIPLYNGAMWIDWAIRSVLAQTHMPDEFIVVDDGSTDGGAAVVERLAAEYPIIKLMRKRNGGQSAARNFAVAHSKSVLIALLDQDDFWYPTHLERLLKPLHGHRALRDGSTAISTISTKTGG